MATNNLKFWNSVKDTPEEFQEKTDNGLTSINAQWRKKQATESWGMYGDKWKLENLRWGTIYNNNALVLHTLDATFVYPNGSFEISVDSLAYDGNANLVTDFRKSMQTDAIGKALSYLGFSADIYMSGVHLKISDKENIGGVKESTQLAKVSKPKEDKETITKGHKKWNDAIEGIKQGTTTVDIVKQFYSVSKEDEKTLLSYVPKYK